jgi:hypothetical protein
MDIYNSYVKLQEGTRAMKNSPTPSYTVLGGWPAMDWIFFHAKKLEDMFIWGYDMRCSLLPQPVCQSKLTRHQEISLRHKGKHHFNL